MQRLWHCNADFDLNLPYTQSTKAPPTLPLPLLEMTDEMAWHFAFVADPDDYVFSPEPWDEEWITLLTDRGLSPPKWVNDLGTRPDLVYSPYGWDKQASQRSQLFQHPPAHPKNEAVQRVNDRLFSWQLEGQLPHEYSGWPIDQASAIENEIDIDKWFQNSKMSRGLLKGRHGMSGIANRLLTPSPWPSSITTSVIRQIRKSAGAILEPWHRLETEMGWRFEVDSKGGWKPMGGHQLLTADGAFRGILISPDSSLPESITTVWNEVTPLIASALSAAGYFGPVGIDGYLHKLEFPGTQQAASKFRPLSDLNARYTMAAGGHGLKRRLGEKYMAHLLINSPHKDWPGTWKTFEVGLGNMLWDTALMSGVTVVSPWRKNTGAWARRLGILVADESQERVLEMVARVFEMERSWKA